jgi:hypothetical protein
VSAWLALVLVGLSAEASGAPPPEESVEFLSISDPHLGSIGRSPKDLSPTQIAELVAQYHQTAQAVPGKLARLIGTRLPPDLASKLDVHRPLAPQALVIAGDLVDGHPQPLISEREWTWFRALYPPEGLPLPTGRLPIYPGYGNHDGNPDGPPRRGFTRYVDALDAQGALAARSPRGDHYAFRLGRLHVVTLNLAPADEPDPDHPFRYRDKSKQALGSWEDPQGAAAFLHDYLQDVVGASGDPVILVHHYGFDRFSTGWNWWSGPQRAAYYRLIAPYNVIALIHGHNHRADHYEWPDAKDHRKDVESIFGDRPPPTWKRYPVFSNGNLTWWFRVEPTRLIAAHHGHEDWNRRLAVTVALSPPKQDNPKPIAATSPATRPAATRKCSQPFFRGDARRVCRLTWRPQTPSGVLIEESRRALRRCAFQTGFKAKRPARADCLPARRRMKNDTGTSIRLQWVRKIFLPTVSAAPSSHEPLPASPALSRLPCLARRGPRGSADGRQTGQHSPRDRGRLGLARPSLLRLPRV